MSLTGSNADERFAVLKREADAIIAAGLWTSGPSDLLSILGRQRDELSHSRLIAWLLTPTGRHGLGRRFLRAFLDEVWPGERLAESGTVTLELEVTRTGLDELGVMHEARADIVLRAEDVAIVIENKVDAGEQVNQCERLYWAWAEDPIETRWLLLSPTGRSPVTATTPQAAAAWRAASYGQLARALNAALGVEVSPKSAEGYASAVQYLRTLGALVSARGGRA